MAGSLTDPEQKLRAWTTAQGQGAGEATSGTPQCLCDLSSKIVFCFCLENCHQLVRLFPLVGHYPPPFSFRVCLFVCFPFSFVRLSARSLCTNGLQSPGHPGPLIVSSLPPRTLV